MGERSLLCRRAKSSTAAHGSSSQSPHSYHFCQHHWRESCTTCWKSHSKEKVCYLLEAYRRIFILPQCHRKYLLVLQVPAVAMKDFSFNLWNKVGQVIMKFRMIDNIYFFQFEDKFPICSCFFWYCWLNKIECLYYLGRFQLSLLCRLKTIAETRSHLIIINNTSIQ